MIIILILIIIIIIIIMIMKTFRKSIYCHFFPFIYKLKSFQPSPATLTPPHPPPSPHSRDVLCGEGDLLTLGVGRVLLPVPGQCVVGVQRHHAHVVRRRRWWQQGTAACRGRQREGGQPIREQQEDQTHIIELAAGQQGELTHRQEVSCWASCPVIAGMQTDVCLRAITITSTTQPARTVEAGLQ